jgi:hypothetical protein
MKMIPVRVGSLDNIFAGFGESPCEIVEACSDVLRFVGRLAEDKKMVSKSLLQRKLRHSSCAKRSFMSSLKSSKAELSLTSGRGGFGAAGAETGRPPPWSRAKSPSAAEDPVPKPKRGEVPREDSPFPAGTPFVSLKRKTAGEVGVGGMGACGRSGIQNGVAGVHGGAGAEGRGGGVRASRIGE